MSKDREPARTDELPSSTRPRFYTSEEFDTLIISQPNLKDTIAGFSTVSATHILKGQTPSSFLVVPWSYRSKKKNINIHLNGLSFDHVYGATDRSEVSFPQNMYNNRTYGGTWFLNEAYQEVEPKRRLAYFEESALNATSVYNALITTSANTYEELVETIELPSHFAKNDIARVHRQFHDLYTKRFSTPENFSRFLKDIHQRKGVQIIYGPAHRFNSFIDQQKKKPLEIDYMGIRLYSSPVPSDLVLGIIPLGDYEKQILSGNSGISEVNHLF